MLPQRVATAVIGVPAILAVIWAGGAWFSVVLGVLLAERFHGEIVSADAMQVYRGFDAATAKPMPLERAACPHALVDVVDPRDDFSLGDFVRAADEAIGRIRDAGRRPVVVGGTGLYLRGLLKGVFEGPRRDPLIRQSLLERARDRRPGLLHRYLRHLDPESSATRTADSRARSARGPLLYRKVRPLLAGFDDGGVMADAQPMDSLRTAAQAAADKKARPKAKAEAKAKAVENAVEKPSPPAKPDDLKKVEGIGPKISGILQGAGITTFAQLADTDEDRIKKILEEADPNLLRLAHPASWPQQARLAADGKWDELERYQKTLKRGRKT